MEAIPLRLPKLDDRLHAAAELFPDCSLGADIGTDHGRLPLHLLHTGRCQRMVVSDISQPALSKARELLTRHHMEARAEFIQADGLNALKEKAEAVALMGMGGDTICGILTTGTNHLSGARLILSPHTEIHKVRETLPAIGYRISREIIARAGGRFYVVIQAETGSASYTEKELHLGPCLLRDRPALFMEYLQWRLRVNDKALVSILRAGGDMHRTAEHKRLEAFIREECS